tara:strand:- start:3119 stop:3307 length:189 start_codon:yes stop_codon:yes gene_type:complete
MGQSLDVILVAGEHLYTGNQALTPENPDCFNGRQLLWDGELRLPQDSLREMSVIFNAVLVTI